MREMGIKAQWIKPFTTTTGDSDSSTELTNILDEQFNPERPNAVWCTDITYIWTQNGFVYLNCVMDLFARKIIAWTLSNTMEVSNVVATINKAKAYRNIESPLIIHSDRGAGTYQMLGVKPQKLCNEAILVVPIHMIMRALNHFIH
jgi:transposase